MFTEYMSVTGKENCKNLIYVPHLLQKYNDLFPDGQVTQTLSNESLPLLVRYVCKVLDKINRPPERMFQLDRMTRDEFVRLLKSEPFNVADECDFPTSLENVVRYSEKIRDASYVNVRAFKFLLDEHLSKLIKRTNLFLQMRKALDEQGQTIDRAILMVQGNQSDTLDNVCVSKAEFVQLCTMAKVDISS